MAPENEAVPVDNAQVMGTPTMEENVPEQSQSAETSDVEIPSTEEVQKVEPNVVQEEAQTGQQVVIADFSNIVPQEEVQEEQQVQNETETVPVENHEPVDMPSTAENVQVQEESNETNLVEENQIESTEPVENAVAENQLAEQPVPQIAENTPEHSEEKPMANWKKLFDDNEEKTTEETTTVEQHVEPKPDNKPRKPKKKTISAEELEQRRLIGNIGDQLKEVRKLKNSVDTPYSAGLVDKEKNILGMMSSVVGTDQIASKKDDKSDFRNYIEEVTGYNGEEPAIEENNLESKHDGKFQNMFDGLEEENKEETVKPHNKFINDFKEEKGQNKFIGEFASVVGEETSEEPVEQTSTQQEFICTFYIFFLLSTCLFYRFF
jgi:hypothetical protein